MDRDTFIITVFCLVSEMYAQVTARRPVRRGGFLPALSDAELITIEVCGEYFKLHTDGDLYDYFAAHYRHFFPRLPSRSLFVRQAADEITSGSRPTSASSTFPWARRPSSRTGTTRCARRCGDCSTPA